MKIQNLIKPAILSLAFSTSALAAVPADYNFAVVKAGGVFPTSLEGNSGLNTGDTTYTAGFEAGRKLMDRYAVSFEYMYRGKNTAHAYDTSVVPQRKDTSWSASSNTFMLNAAADLVTDYKIRPYVKAGLGISMNKSYDYRNHTTENDDQATFIYSGKTTNDFAWQLGAGLSMNTCSKFDTQLEYMFVSRGDVKTEDNYVNGSTTTNSPARTGQLKDHVVTVGIKFKF